jgi:hypothetical protein
VSWFGRLEFGRLEFGRLELGSLNLGICGFVIWELAVGQLGIDEALALARSPRVAEPVLSLYGDDIRERHLTLHPGGP